MEAGLRSHFCFQNYNEENIFPNFALRRVPELKDGGE